MTNEAIEAAARAMCEASPFDDDKPSDYYAEVRAAAPALMEEGARLALEAAAKEANSQWRAVLDAKDILALSPAAIVKGAGRDRN
jgi:hypothetical protein